MCLMLRHTTPEIVGLANVERAVSFAYTNGP